jgi:hypothetical protein
MLIVSVILRFIVADHDRGVGAAPAHETHGGHQHRKP